MIRLTPLVFMLVPAVTIIGWSLPFHCVQHRGVSTARVRPQYVEEIGELAHGHCLIRLNTPDSVPVIL